MDVNSFHRALGSRTIKLFVTIVIACCAIFFLAAFITGRSEADLISKRINIAVRAIGHDVLLRAGDSTSLVRPVIEKSRGVFLLEFENEFVFQPEILSAIVKRILDKTGLTRYTVTVYKCFKPEIVFGFDVNPPGYSMMPCAGRTQPKADRQYSIGAGCCFDQRETRI
jgi:hypothetical protein